MDEDNINPLLEAMVDRLRNDTCDELTGVPVIDDVLFKIECTPPFVIPKWREPRREPIENPNYIPVVIFVMMALIILIFVVLRFT